MKVLIAISCILAVASAGYLAGPAPYAAVAPAAYAVAHTAYLGPQHLPVIGPNGVPLEPAENVAARAQHAAAHVEAAVRNGDVAIAAPVAYAGAPLAYAGAHLAAAAPLAYAAHGAILAAPQHLPVIGPNGVPLEPAANVAARAQHAASHIEAKVRNGDLAVLGRKRRGIVNSLAAPLAAHAYAAAPFAAHAYAAAPLAAHAYAAPAVYAAQPAYLGPQHLPVIGPNGVPLEPAANVAARAQHAHAHVEAAVRNGDVAIAAAAPLVAGPAVYAAQPAYLGPQHLPVIGPNGVPLEPAENVAARAQHAASHIEAKARNGDIAIAAPLAAPALAYSGLDAHLAAKVAAGIL